MKSDSGATAVEFALVMIPLLVILCGIVDFGSAFSNDLSLSAAAREGVRVMAVKNDSVQARSAIRTATAQLSPSLNDGQIQITTDAQIPLNPVACAPGATVTVTITYLSPSLSGMFSLTITAVGVMVCGG